MRTVGHSATPKAEISSEEPEQVGFPKFLLSRTAGERVAYFRNKVIEHDAQAKVMDQLLQAIQYPTGGQVIAVFGGSGVGKTTLSRTLYRRLLKNAREEMLSKRGMIAAVLYEMRAPTASGASGSYWVETMSGLLAALQEPMLDQKFDYSKIEERANSEGGGPNGWAGATVERLVLDKKIEFRKLRSALESCLIHRNVSAVLLDEAHHLKKAAAGGRTLLDQMDVLKSLVNVTGVSLVMFGTYELQSLLELSDQLCRRCVSIPYPRYDILHNGGDIGGFGDVLHTFQVSLPLKEEPQLLEIGEYLFGGCLGCVGTLKDWLVRALRAAVEDGERQPFRKYCEAQRLTDSELINIMRQIRQGEQWLFERNNRQTELQMLLSTPPAVTESAGSGAMDRVHTGNSGEADGGSRANTTKSRKKRGRPGERKPRRDPVGADC
ncbi:MAG: ATP-binding protein [Chloroflexota bacterium]|nr:ATP-binding protein [Chloroflexota bacterium]MDQ5867157.1 ATP-binding protein [Chloroflexota bacterium]